MLKRGAKAPFFYLKNMGKIKLHLPVKSFAAISFRSDYWLEAALEELEALLGPVILKSAIFSESGFTNYYEAEMGPQLNKLFAAFQTLIPAEYLVDLKIKTNKIEQQFLKEGKRTVNIDPGYLTEAKVVLATTKDYSHRLYLGKGIYGDLHLNYSKKSFQALPWTYPDYQQETALYFFNDLRALYKEESAIILKNT